MLQHIVILILISAY